MTIFGDVSQKALLALGANNVLKTINIEILKKQSQKSQISFIFADMKNKEKSCHIQKNGILNYDEIINKTLI